MKSHFLRLQKFGESKGFFVMLHVINQLQEYGHVFRRILGRSKEKRNWGMISNSAGEQIRSSSCTLSFEEEERLVRLAFASGRSPAPSSEIADSPLDLDDAEWLAEDAVRLVRRAHDGELEGQSLLGECYLVDWSDYDLPNQRMGEFWTAKAANAGDLDAMFRWAYTMEMHENWNRAADWYTRAAQRGCINSCYNLGYLYISETPIKDYARGYKYFEECKEEYRRLGDYACYALQGSMHLHARGVPRDYAKAFHWNQIAAERGQNLSAIENLGFLFERGLGVQQDFKRAREYYTRAAECGSSMASVQLAVMYERAFLLCSLPELNEEFAGVYCGSPNRMWHPDASRVDNDDEFKDGYELSDESSQALRENCSDFLSSNSSRFRSLSTNHSESHILKRLLFLRFSSWSTARCDRNLGRLTQHEALYWWRKAVADASNELGITYDHDIIYQREEAARGDLSSSIYCAVIHAYGFIGVPQDVPRALRFFRNAIRLSSAPQRKSPTRLFARKNASRDTGDVFCRTFLRMHSEWKGQLCEFGFSDDLVNIVFGYWLDVQFL
eukprot:471449_1